MTSEGINNLIVGAVATRERIVVANHNLHSFYLLGKKGRMADFYRLADFTHIDGIPLVFMARALGFDVSRHERITSLDWCAPMFANAVERGWKMFYLGARPGVADRGAQVLRERWPRLNLETHHGYFDRTPGGDENEAVVATINRADPDVLLVGMGMPIQEDWLAENVKKLSARVIVPIGAFIDYVAGEIPTPPRWAGRFGLEWLFRFLAEPRRLAGRYLVEPWFAVLRLLGALGRPNQRSDRKRRSPARHQSK